MAKRINYLRSEVVLGFGLGGIFAGIIIGLFFVFYDSDSLHELCSLVNLPFILIFVSCVNLLMLGLVLYGLSSIVRASEIFRAEHGDKTVVFDEETNLNSTKEN